MYRNRLIDYFQLEDVGMSFSKFYRVGTVECFKIRWKGYFFRFFEVCSFYLAIYNTKSAEPILTLQYRFDLQLVVANEEDVADDGEEVDEDDGQDAGQNDAAEVLGHWADHV